MSSNIMKVYYGVDRLPYKDSARSVHYPIVGQEFKGASDITEIRFYVDRIGGTENTLWVANTKLPNGNIGYKKLEATRDSEIGEYYVSLSLSQFYTQYKGDVYISLNGYQGGVELHEEEDGNYTLVGNPIMSATGSIKLTVAYSVQPLPSDIYEYISLDDILAYISGLPTQEFIQNRSVPRVQITNTQYNNTPIADIISEYGFIATEFEPYTFVLEIKGVSNYGTYLIDIVGASSLTPEQAKVKVIDLVRVRDGVTSATFDISTNTFKDLITGLAFNTYVRQTNGTYKVYGTNDSGNATYYNVDEDSVGNGKVVRRDTNSQIVVPLTPTANGHATSKSYVDTFGYSISMSLDSSTYVLTLLLKDKNNNTLSTQTIDLPLESVVVSGEYDSDTQSIILTLQNGNTITIPVGDLISGLATTTDLQNGLATKQDTLTFDNTPTQGSTNPVTSGGIKSYVDSHGGGLAEYEVQTDTNVQGFVSSNALYGTLFVLVCENTKYFAYFYWQDFQQNKSAFEIEEIGGTARFQGYQVDLSNLTFDDILDDTYSAFYELESNKVTSLSQSSTNTQYPSAKCVYDNLQDLREVAEGKCKTYVLSYNETPNAYNFGSSEYYDATSKSFIEFQSAAELTTWVDGASCLNSNFNSQNDTVGMPVGTLTNNFLIFRNAGTKDYSYIRVKDIFVNSANLQTLMKRGDIILVVQTDVPDRWYSANYNVVGVNTLFYKLETAKVDLTNYYTKAQSDSKYALLSTLAPAYDNTATYSVGDKCVYGGKLFICTTAITQAEDFDNTHWQEMTIAGDYVDTSSAQTISGDKTFTTGTKLEFQAMSNTYFLKGDSSYLLVLGIGNSNYYYWSNNYFEPAVNNSKDLGTNIFKWRNLYLSGNISDGTNEVSVADLAALITYAKAQGWIS